jgi:hypothetical protein
VPIETFYGNSPDEQADLLELRKAYYETLRHLEKQAARYDESSVPANIAVGIKEAQANIRAIDEKRLSPIASETAAQLGDTGRFAVLTSRLDWLGEQMRLMQTQSDDYRTQQQQREISASRAQRREQQRLRKEVANVVKQVAALEERSRREDDKREHGQRLARFIYITVSVAMLLIAVAFAVVAFAIARRLI